jgi:hypothetical protein
VSERTGYVLREELINMTKRIAELLAMVLIGDGVIALAAPRRHSRLWKFGPEGYRRAIEAFAQRPALTRLLAAGQVGLGLWLALRQYEGE